MQPRPSQNRTNMPILNTALIRNTLTNLFGRSASAWTMSCVVLMTITGLTGARAVGQANEAKSAWGRRTWVWVASEDIPAGAALATRARRVEWPKPLVPADALGGESLDDDPGSARFAAYPVAEGQILVAAHLAPGNGRFPLTPPGDVAVAIPVAPSVVAAEPGDRVRAIASTTNGIGPLAEGADEEPPAESAEVLSIPGVVVGVNDSQITVAVAAADADALAQEVLSGSVALVYAQPDGTPG